MAEIYGNGLDHLRDVYHTKKFTDIEDMIRKTNTLIRAIEEYLDIHYEEPTIPVSGKYVRNDPCVNRLKDMLHQGKI